MFPGAPTARFPFYRAGADFRFKYRHFELYGLGMHGHDDNLQINAAQNGYMPLPAVTYSGGFVESEYWIHPWLIGILRYDMVNSPADLANGFSQSTTRNQFGPGLQILFRSNIKGVFELQHGYGRPVTGTPLFYHPTTVVVGVDFVM
jgi:hypothetical protein